MAICKYKKSYEDLTAEELRAIISRLEPTADLTKLKNKATLKLKLDQLFSDDPNNSHSENQYFYFDACDQNKSTTNKDKQTINVDDYDRLRPRNWNFPHISENENSEGENDHEISELHDNTSIKSEVAASIQSNAQQIEQLTNIMAMNKNNSNLFREKIKIEYTESLGVPAFIRQIEEWALLNDQDDTGKIRKACACLVLSRDGLAARECLNDDPMQSWSDFKIQLFDILGKDRSHYKKEFKTMTKKPYETYGGFLSRMTLNYKYGRSLDDVKLSAHHKNDIKQAFIDALDHPVKGFVEFEDDLGNITYENVAKRAMQAHRAHVPNKIEDVCHLRHSNTRNEQNTSQIRDVISEQNILKQMVKNQTTMMEKLIELMSNQNFPVQSSRQNNSRGQSNQNTSRVFPAHIREKMSKQDCYAFQQGNCRWGERCFRKHSKN